MNNIKPNETRIVGWTMTESGAASNEDSRRIGYLVKHCLVKLGNDSSGWGTLFTDPSDGRLWEMIFPYSERHGGGPPELHCISAEEAKEKYGLP